MRRGERKKGNETWHSVHMPRLPSLCAYEGVRSWAVDSLGAGSSAVHVTSQQIRIFGIEPSGAWVRGKQMGMAITCPAFSSWVTALDTRDLFGRRWYADHFSDLRCRLFVCHRGRVCWSWPRDHGRVPGFVIDLGGFLCSKRRAGHRSSYSPY